MEVLERAKCVGQKLIHWSLINSVKSWTFKISQLHFVLTIWNCICFIFESQSSVFWPWLWPCLSSFTFIYTFYPWIKMKDKISHDRKKFHPWNFWKIKKSYPKIKKSYPWIKNSYPSILSINTIYICSVVCKIEG